MSPGALMIIAFLIALVVMAGAFAGGAVIVAVPVAVVALALIGFLDVKRRRTQTQNVHEFREEAATGKVDFTERDKETLTTE